MKNTLIPLACLGLALASASAGVISVTGPLTTDASSGISTSNTYTHAVAGGRATTVNGVNFALLSPAVTPANFNWVATGGKNEIVGNRNTWNPATGGVVGPGLTQSPALTGLLDSFTYSGAGADPGSSQTFTLSGLIVGITYDARLYLRSWDLGGSGRPITLTFTNGAEVNSTTGPEDRPGTILGTGNEHQALYVNYRYTALTPNLVINAAVPAAAPVGSGSFHMFGVTNQVIPEPCTALSLALGLGLIGSARRRRS